MKLFHRAVLLLVLSGCPGTPAKFYTISDEGLSKTDTKELLGAYAMTGAERIEKELMRREIFNEQEWARIRQRSAKTVDVGMTENELIATLGWPTEYTDATTGTTKSMMSYGVYLSHYPPSGNATWVWQTGCGPDLIQMLICEQKSTKVVLKNGIVESVKQTGY